MSVSNGGKSRGAEARAGDGAPARPLMRYLGGKWRLGPWVIAHFPPHDIYVEPFGGGASVLLQKPRCRTETYNDLDGEVVNLFRVLRSPAWAELIRQVDLMPYARAEYREAWKVSTDPLERALRMLVRSHMGHGTAGYKLGRNPGFRRDGVIGATNVAGERADLPEGLRAIVARLRGVSIDNKPAAELIAYWDSPRALIYLDPPYLPDTRSKSGKRAGASYDSYAHELTIEDHAQLLDQALASKAMLLISGYPSDLYESRLQSWTRREVKARSHRNLPRTEVLWINPLAASRMGAGPLFASAPASLAAGDYARAGAA